MQRTAKRNINYKETRTYNEKQLEDIDITRRSTLTKRIPVQSRRSSVETHQYETNDNTFTENIETENQATPQESPTQSKNPATIPIVTFYQHK